MKLSDLLNDLNALLSSEGDINVIVAADRNRSIEEIGVEKCVCDNKLVVIYVDESK